MVEIFKNTNINFLGFRKKAFIISGILIAATFASIIYYGGFNLSVDFVGGTLTIIKFEKPVQKDIGKIREIINNLGLGSPEVKTVGTLDKNEVQITVKKKCEGSFVSDQIKTALSKEYSDNPFTLEKEERVGPKVSAELAQKALIAILLSWMAIVIYMAFRFKLPHGVAAVSGLIHDVIITTGVFTIRDAEISLSFVAAILTVIGYSLNDTIVVFDRIRENTHKGQTGKSFEDLINSSINQTLSRTIITVLTVLFVVSLYFFLGGESTRDLSLAMLVGTIIGTYSTYFVSSPVLMYWNKKWPIKSH
ncbi:MAG TPA: protein translocase subunit SecF [Fibrobacteres bacterium]|nr:protein translocase subunit SecF [Fibrobacterota bacterium]